MYSRGNNKCAIFVDDRDRLRFLALLGEVVVSADWCCLAYCLMANHFHLLVETPRANLAYGMQRLLGDYARGFNDRHGRSGHLFGGRYGSVRVLSDSQLFATLVYIAENPVEAGLCRLTSEYRWSSHGAIARENAPAWLDSGRRADLGQPSTTLKGV